MKPLYWRSVNSKYANYAYCTITGTDEINWNEMNDMSVEKWWNDICGRGKREKPEKTLPRPRFVHHETHIEWPRRELGTPAVRGKRLTACATRPPIKYLNIQNYRILYCITLRYNYCFLDHCNEFLKAYANAKRMRYGMNRMLNETTNLKCLCVPYRSTHSSSDCNEIFTSCCKHACGGFANFKYLKIVLAGVPGVAFPFRSTYRSSNCYETFKSCVNMLAVVLEIQKNLKIVLDRVPCVALQDHTPFIGLWWNFQKLL